MNPLKSEEQCVKEFQCCWNPIQPVKCFVAKKPGLHPGITAGAAVAATLFVVAVVGGAYFYYNKFGFGAPRYDFFFKIYLIYF